MLYLPGNDVRKAEKVKTLDVDSVCLDMEDAVAFNRKEEARATITKLLSEGDFGRSEKGVRINDIASPFWKDDLKALFEAPVLPDLLVVPKVDTAQQLAKLFEFVEELRKARKKMDLPNQQIRLLTQVESALGLLNLREILEVDRMDLFESPTLIHDGIIFGGDDYAASIGATRSTTNKELLYARQCVVAHAKAYEMQAIDIVNIRFKDTQQLDDEAREGCGMGFTGKQIIHPNQVSVVQAAFTPAKEQIARAVAIITAYRMHEKAGKGAFSFQNQMIDAPTIKQCENVVQLAYSANLIDEALQEQLSAQQGEEEPK